MIVSAIIGVGDISMNSDISMVEYMVMLKSLFGTENNFEVPTQQNSSLFFISPNK